MLFILRSETFLISPDIRGQICPDIRGQICPDIREQICPDIREKIRYAFPDQDFML